MSAAIEVERLTKRYGEHAAVDGISFEVQRGEVVGFLGPNGAGKSTTLRILAGFLGATSGTARVEGHDVATDPDSARRRTGYMPEAVPLYGEMRVREYLRFRADLKGVPSRERTMAIGRAMELARVDDVADTLIEHLSKGYRQRVGLADALVAKPPLLILDEPTAGMDPNQIREVRALIRSLGGRQTVLLSTHILSEVEASCERVIVIDRGKIVLQGSPRDLAERRGAERVELIIRADVPPFLALEGLEGAKIASCRDIGQGLMRLALEIAVDSNVGNTTEEVVTRLSGAGIKIREVSPAKASLEDVFAAVTHGDDDEDLGADDEGESEEDGEGESDHVDEPAASAQEGEDASETDETETETEGEPRRDEEEVEK